MSGGYYLLDTNLLLLWLRGGSVCDVIEEQFHLASSGLSFV